MRRKMRRGKQQVLFNYLPGKTFDFERVGTIAQITSIRGIPKTELNLSLILRAIEDEVSAWREEFRPAFRNTRNDPNQLRLDANNYVLLEPRGAQATVYPLMFWCQNQACHRVFNRSSSGPPAQPICSSCKQGRLVQLRWIRIHRCGEMQPLLLYCSKCKSSDRMALDTRGSERLSGFRVICRKCKNTSSLFGGYCQSCTWPDTKLRTMDIEVHRAGRTFYPHYIVMLNQPGRGMDAFLSLPQWPEIAAAAFFELPELEGRRLVDFAPSASNTSSPQALTLSNQEIEALKSRGFSDSQIEQFRQMQSELQTSRTQTQQESSPVGIAQVLIQRTGIPGNIWQRVGQELLEAVTPLQSSSTQELFNPQNSELISTERQVAVNAARRLGFSKLTLVMDFPMTTATFGFSRTDYQPNTCRLNPFPPDPDHQGKFPVFVDKVQADALMLRLDAQRVWTWLERNNLSPNLSSIQQSNIELGQRSYFVRLLNETPLRETIDATRPEARMVFGLLHTLSHLSVRRAALLCGLDRTSLSEYVLPSALTFAIYCNHRFGATIGALTALFEQSLAEWLNQIYTATRRCVYDPVCADQSGSCHACTHLAETSCRFFNLNLGRAFLFGGRDPELGIIRVGYFDPSLQ